MNKVSNYSEGIDCCRSYSNIDVGAKFKEKT